MIEPEVIDRMNRMYMPGDFNAAMCRIPVCDKVKRVRKPARPHPNATPLSEVLCARALYDFLGWCPARIAERFAWNGAKVRKIVVERTTHVYAKHTLKDIPEMA